MHETWDEFIIFGIFIVMNTLDERRGTITDTDYRYINLTQNSLPLFSVVLSTSRNRFPNSFSLHLNISGNQDNTMVSFDRSLDSP